MARFEDLENAGFRVAYDDDGEMIGIVTQKGLPVPFVTSNTNPLTGRLENSGAPYVEPNTAQDIIVAGDSFLVFGEDFFTVATANLATAITFNGSIAKVNFTSHGLQSLQKIYVLNASPSEFCGEKVATRIDADNFSFPCSIAAGTTVSLPDNGYGGTTWTGTVFMRQTGYAASNPFYAANARAGHPFNVVRNVAVNSRTAKQMEAEADRDILAYSAPWVVTSGGANEVRVASQTVAVAVAAAKSYLLKLVNGGKKVIYTAWQPLTPGSSVGLDTIRFNQSVSDWCKDNGVIFVDSHSACVDPTSTNGQAVANIMAQVDGVHLAPPSAERIAPLFIAAWSDKIAPVRILPTSAGESVANDASSPQKYRNPLLLTATGGSNTTGMTGTVAANVTIGSPSGAVTGTMTVPARTLVTNGDAFGNNQRIVVTPTNASEVQIKFTLTAGDFSALDEVIAGLAVDVTNVAGSNLFLCGLYLEVAAGTTRYFGDMKLGQGLGTNRLYESDFRKVLVSPKAVLQVAPSSITIILWLQFSAAGSALTVDVGRPFIRKTN